MPTLPMRWGAMRQTLCEGGLHPPAQAPSLLSVLLVPSGPHPSIRSANRFFLTETLGIPHAPSLHLLPRARPSSLLISLAELSHYREVLEVGDFHKAKPLNPRAASLSFWLLQSVRNPAHSHTETAVLGFSVTPSQATLSRRAQPSFICLSL